MKPRITITGAKELQRKLDKLEKQGAKRAMRKATRAGTAVLLKAVRAATPVDEGKLKKFQDMKITAKGAAAAGIVGANVEKMQEASEQPESTPSYRPANIDWLTENGHVTPDGRFVPPSGYTRRAAAEAMPRAEAAFTAKLAAEIEKEAEK